MPGTLNFILFKNTGTLNFFNFVLFLHESLQTLYNKSEEEEQSLLIVKTTQKEVLLGYLNDFMNELLYAPSWFVISGA